MNSGRVHRREALRSLAAGSILLPGIVTQLLADDGRAGSEGDSLAPRAPHFTPCAKA